MFSSNSQFISASLAVILGLFFTNCQRPSIHEETFIPSSSWELIQKKIFEPNCVPCHSHGNRFARQSDLVLTWEEGYEQLVNREPNNISAKENGLLLLGTDGIKSLHESFLWEKINAADAEHFYTDHPEYGELMPIGGPYFTVGELEYIREWILKGAPKDGIVVSDDILEDKRSISLSDDFPLTLDFPDHGSQLHIGPFNISPNKERELFYFQPLNNTQDIFINKFEILMRPGSHHFLLYRYKGKKPDPNTYRDLYRPNGNYKLSTILSIQDRIFVFGSNRRYNSYSFPEGVALKIPANDGFDLNSHYVNRSQQNIQGEIWANIHTIPSNEVVHIADNLFLNNKDIKLPPHQVTTLSKEFHFSERRYVFMLLSHAHKHNESFSIYISGGARDGELVYYSRDWEHSPFMTYDPPIILEPGTGLRAEAVFRNDTDKKIKFGTTSEDEMMLILGTYYVD